MIIVVAGVIGYILFLYLMPYAEDKFNQSETEKKRLQKLIAEEENYLRSISMGNDRNYKVNQLNGKITRQKKLIKSYRERIVLLDQNFEKLSEILFNTKSWSKMIDSIATQANTIDVELLELNNRYVTGKENFGHVLEISLRCQGNYNNLLSFMNDLEQSKLVTDIFYSDVHVDMERSTTVADINISVWGVNR